MGEQIKSFDEFIAEIKDAINFHITESTYHLSEASRFERLLKVATDSNIAEPSNNGILKDESLATGQSSTIEDTTSQDNKPTFEDINIGILDDDMPRTVRQLASKYHQITGIEYDRKDYSAKLANIRKTKKTLKSVEYKELPTEHRFWWGKAEWFNGDDLKSEYKEKIFKHLGIAMQNSMV